MSGFEKRGHLAQITQIELLVWLECAIYDELNGVIHAAIRQSVAKLWAAMRPPLAKRCFELDAFIQ